MPIKSKAADFAGRYTKHIVRDNNVLPVVATTPSHLPAFSQHRFISLTDAGHEMAIDGSSGGGGSDEIIWNGTGASDTGGDWARTGTANMSESSAADRGNGTNGLNVADMDRNEYFRFRRTQNLSLGNFTAISFWVRPFQSSAVLRIRWEDDNYDQVGNQLLVSNYITWQSGSWQQVVIPIDDFQVTGDVRSIRFQSGQNNRAFYFDDFELSAVAGGGGPQVFRIWGNTECDFDVNEILITLTADDTGWAYNDFATIDGGLSAGLLLRYFDYMTAETWWQYNLIDNRDLLGRLKVRDTVTFLTSNTMLSLMLDLSKTPSRLRRTAVLDLIVRDDLSSLTSMEAWAVGGESVGYFEGSTVPGARQKWAEEV